VLTNGEGPAFETIAQRLEELLFSPAASLKPLGVPESFAATVYSERGGMSTRGFAVKAGGKMLSIATFVTPEGKFDQFPISKKPKL
jgi:hypothetical protein